MNGLMLHCGAKQTTYDQVASTRTPEGTRTHQPISHRWLIDSATENLIRLGYQPRQCAHALSHGGARYFGLIEFGVGALNAPANDHGMVMGLRNSHDKRFPAGMVVGARVFVCDNLSFSGELILARKHTRHIGKNLPYRMQTVMDRLPSTVEVQAARFETYRNSPLGDSEAHDLIVEGFRAGACSSSMVGKIAEEYHEPRHEAFRPRTAWSLFNAFSETLKGGLQALPARTQTLHRILDAHLGIARDAESGILNLN